MTNRERKTAAMHAHLAEAGRLEADADRIDQEASEMAAVFPAGVGSMRPRSGRDTYRAGQHRASGRAHDLRTRARHERSLADSLRVALDREIWDDDPDAIDRLQSRIAASESRRAAHRELAREALAAGDRQGAAMSRQAAESVGRVISRDKRRIRSLGGEA